MEYQPDMGGSYGEEPLTTFQIWVMAITQPVEETYSRILANPNKSVGMALVWIFVVSLIGSTISMISNAIFGSYLTAPRLLDLGEYSSIFEDMAEYTSGGFSIGQVLCIPVWAVVAVIVFLIQAGVIHFIAGALGGNGSYSDLIYVNATFAAPIGLVTSVVSAIPVVGCFGIFVGLYGLYLGVVALKVVHRFDWGKAVATYGILIGIVVVFVCVIFTLMAAAITQLFEALGV
jgi:hypothetical protein